MGTEHNERVFRQFVDAVSSGNLDDFEQSLHPDAVFHFPGVPDPVRGPDGVRAMVEGTRAAFSDLRVTIDDAFAVGDRLAARVTGTGTNNGEFMGMPATGRTATWSVAHLVRFAEGRIIEDWPHPDFLAILGQLGALPGA